MLDSRRALSTNDLKGWQSVGSLNNMEPDMSDSGLPRTNFPRIYQGKTHHVGKCDVHVNPT